MPVKAAEVIDISDYYNLVAEVESGSGSLPAKFDLRDYGLVTPVRNQNSTDTCYAHATLAAIESNAYRLTGKEYKWIGNTATGTFVDKNVKSGTSYTYKVAANKGDLKSAYSAAKSSKAK